MRHYGTSKKQETFHSQQEAVQRYDLIVLINALQFNSYNTIKFYQIEKISYRKFYKHYYNSNMVDSEFESILEKIGNL